MTYLEKQLNCSDEKKLLRRQILKIRNEMPQTEREQKSEVIRQKLYQMPIYKNADVILAYVDYQSEVITTPIIEKALAEGKIVYCPKVDGNDMDFYRITDLSDLVEGYKGIREPVPEAERKFAPEMAKDVCQGTLEKQIEEMRQILMLMPGAVFDKNRHRIGYGKGFYDRYLNKMTEVNQKVSASKQMEFYDISTIALAFSCQIVEEVPAEDHDIRPDMLLTEEQKY